MCGIFGLYLKEKSTFSKENTKKSIINLINFSMQRGQDSSGIFFHENNKNIILKKAGSPKLLIDSQEFESTINASLSSNQDHFFAMGQCRLVMSGSAIQELSNQPIVFDNIIGLHNGIFTKFENNNIAADSKIFHQSDSYYFFKHIDAKNITNEDELKNELKLAEGSYNLALFSNNNSKLFLSSNSGSLFYFENSDIFIFASESSFIEKTLINFSINKPIIHQIKNREIVSVTIPSFKEKNSTIFIPSLKPNLIRCKKCILPHTYPMIKFNKDGICNFCLSHENQKLFGEKKLLEILDKNRSKDGSPDCLVGMSGGRDSSYGIYLLTKKYGMTPLLYTFDWGLTTDASRRNQAKICGKLGLEHILRAPDIEERRRHVRKNVDAFLKRPHLGMVPLFMAGDKDFYHYGRLIRKEHNLNLTVHCTGHEVERLHFKTGFCGVDDTQIHNVRLYDFSFFNKMKLAFFYVSQYLLNPSYINESFFYSLRSFAYSFLEKDDFLYLYQFIQWDEKVIEETIKRELDWEPDLKYGKNQWRMGDGQTAFTNYIYYKVAGFSEYDNFRANQVRLNLLSRDEALKLAEEDNIPKLEILQYFAEVVGINLEDTLKHINNIPRLY